MREEDLGQQVEKLKLQVEALSDQVSRSADRETVEDLYAILQKLKSETTSANFKTASSGRRTVARRKAPVDFGSGRYTGPYVYFRSEMDDFVNHVSDVVDAQADAVETDFRKVNSRFGLLDGTLAQLQQDCSAAKTSIDSLQEHLKSLVSFQVSAETLLALREKDIQVVQSAQIEAKSVASHLTSRVESVSDTLTAWRNDHAALHGDVKGLQQAQNVSKGEQSATRKDLQLLSDQCASQFDNSEKDLARLNQRFSDYLRRWDPGHDYHKTITAEHAFSGHVHRIAGSRPISVGSRPSSAKASAKSGGRKLKANKSESTIMLSNDGAFASSSTSTMPHM